MKLYRSQLDQLISKQLFEISTEDLKLDNHQFINNEIFCTITVDSASNGYRIYGDLKGKVLESCDRCLVSYENDKIIFLNVILSNNDDLINNIDTIPFKDSEDFIDLDPIIHDLVLLDSPIKQLCSDDCKGLCTNCGINLNKSLCKCAGTGDDHRWDELKKLTN
ncbi:MAG: DUF177 domain-containing protein [SAR202 cluster bacterium]|nr:DUF177 domain-containing protein [SAR202 cluster bacterium]